MFLSKTRRVVRRSAPVPQGADRHARETRILDRGAPRQVSRRDRLPAVGRSLLVCAGCRARFQRARRLRIGAQDCPAVPSELLHRAQNSHPAPSLPKPRDVTELTAPRHACVTFCFAVSLVREEEGRGRELPFAGKLGWPFI